MRRRAPPCTSPTRTTCARHHRAAREQDRVIQWYGGAVHMDFSPSTPRENAYTAVPIEVLPPLYLAYNTRLLGDSGKVHSPVKARFEAGEPIVVEGMRQLAANTDKALAALLARDYAALADLMDVRRARRPSLHRRAAHERGGQWREALPGRGACAAAALLTLDSHGSAHRDATLDGAHTRAAHRQANFALRRSIYGDAVVGERNIELIETARALGFAAKFSGSGGGVICLKRMPAGGGGMAEDSTGRKIEVTSPLELSEKEEEETRKAFAEKGFTFVRIRFDEDHSGGGRSPLPVTPSSTAAMRGAVLQID